MPHLLSLLCCAFLLWAAPAVADSPEQAITDIQRAIDNRDAELFIQRVDVNTLVPQAVSVALESLTDPDRTAERTVQLPASLSLILAGAKDPALRAPVQQVLVKECTQFLSYGVRSGHFAGLPDASVPASGLLAPYLEDLTPGRKTLALAGKIRRKEAEALVPVRFHDAGSGETNLLQVQMREEDGWWKVRGIDNLPELMQGLPALR